MPFQPDHLARKAQPVTQVGRPDPKARPATMGHPDPQVRKVHPAPPEMMAHPEHKALKDHPAQPEPTAHRDRRDPKVRWVILEVRKVRPDQREPRDPMGHPVPKARPAK